MKAGDGFEEFSNDISSIPEGIQVETDFTISEGTLSAASVLLSEPVTVNIPDGVTTIGAGAFQNNLQINVVNMPDSVTTTENPQPWLGTYGAFYSCKQLLEINFSNSLVVIGQSAFLRCATLTSPIFPSTLKTIHDQAFSECYHITSVDLSSTQITSIGRGAFDSCIALTTLILPDSITSIGTNAFVDCDALTDIYYTGTQQQYEAIQGISNCGFKGTETIHYNYTPAE